MKKLIYLGIVTISLLFIMEVDAINNTYYTNRENIGMTEIQYNNLINLGFTEDEIHNMDIDTFNANKNINASLEAIGEGYYKVTTTTINGVTTSETKIVTKEEYDNAPLQNITYFRDDGFSESNYKYMRTTISLIATGTYRYKVTLTWKNMPSKRSHDIIGIGLQQAYVQRATDIVCHQDFTYSSGSIGQDYSCSPKYVNTGASAVIQLPTGTLNALSSYLYYSVIKANGVGTVTNMTAGGDYSHATSTISQSNALNHSVNHAGGIILNASIENYYDAIPVAQADWYGTW